MEKKIIETANKYKKMADMIAESATEASFDDSVPGYIGDALLHLFYAKSLELKLDTCQNFIDEDTDMEAIDAVFEADKKIGAAADKAFSMVEDYAKADTVFAKMIDTVSFDEDTDNAQLEQLLYQLYKCEGIIRMAYNTARSRSIYGGSTRSWERLEGIDDTVEPPEDAILKDTGIDMDKLYSVRERLVNAIEKKTGAKKT